MAIIKKKDAKKFQDELKKANQEGSEDERKELLKSFRDYKDKGQIQFVTFHQSYGYEEFIEGLRPILGKEDQTDEKQEIQYEIRSGVFKAFCDKINKANEEFRSKPENKDKEPSDNYVFIIDEINRGNISKIFGELITLIEESKRQGEADSMEAVLPQSQEKFSLPNNLYIIGTMNTADRSITQIDTALRRRFAFREMMPNTDCLKFNVGGIEIDKMLEKINQRIEFLYDREHTIGHTYFLPLKKTPDLDTLDNIFRYKIIPLLQEYFFEDYEKIRLVLGDTDKTTEYQFIQEETIGPRLFPEASNLDFDGKKIYKINKNFKEAAYRGIYGKINEQNSDSSQSDTDEENE